MPRPIVDIVGKKFNKLLVIRQVQSSTSGNARFLCKCDCGNLVEVQSYKLRKGMTRNCGCERKIKNSKLNTYEIIEDIAIFKDNKGNTFVIDSDLVDKIKEFTWYVNQRGYVHCAKMKILLHRFLTNCPNDMVVDHINHKTTDNRLSNLRVCTHTENMQNSRLYESNTSGHVGVYEYAPNKFRARITLDTEEIHLGVFDNIEDAIAERKKAELIYYNKGVKI